ncbi:hypothetical protein [Nocardia xishanensis]
MGLLDNISEEDTDELLSAVREMGITETAQRQSEKGYTRVPTALQAAIRLLDRHFGARMGALCFGELRQAKRYLLEPDLREAALGRVDAVANEQCRVLIGHSLGSVVAMDFSIRHPERTFDLLLTLGSPLGLTFVRDKLVGPANALTRPPNVGRWVNVRDPRDPVACVAAESIWGGVAEFGVNNQSDAHSVERYLGKRPVGEALLTTLPELAR